MRIEINTGQAVKDRDVRALYLINEAMKISTPRMRSANIDFIYDKLLCGDYDGLSLKCEKHHRSL